jgi:hypothetical protein
LPYAAAPGLVLLLTDKATGENHMHSVLKNTGVTLLLVLLFPVSLYAEEAGKPLVEKLQESNLVITASVQGCDDDIKKHCAGLGDNADKVFMCLAAYEDHLTPACKQGILEAALSVKMGAAALDYSIRACEADADEFCLDVQPGEGRMIGCIKANESKVSEECITALKETGLWDVGK